MSEPNQGTPVVEPGTPVVTPPEKPQTPAKEPVTEKVTPAPSGQQPTPVAPTTPTETLVEIDGEKLSVDELKKGYLRQKDYTQKTQTLANDRKKLEEITGIISPKEPEVIQPLPLTKEDLDQILIDRDARKDQEIKMKTEIIDLEKNYDGKDGKPKYDDKEVLTWQQANRKMYLSPREAFEQFKKSDIIEWEVKQRIKNAGKPVFQEKPGAGSEVKIPEGKTSFIKTGPKGKLEEDADGRKKAILETWEISESE